MRARGFAFACLILLFGWGCYETHRALYEYFDFQVEIPDPGEDLSQPRVTPADNQSLYGIAPDGTLVRVGGNNPQSGGGIPVKFIYAPIGEATDEMVREYVPIIYGTPQTRPSSTLTDTERFERLKTLATKINEDGVIVSSEESGVRILALNPTPMPNDPGTARAITDPTNWLDLTNTHPTIVPAEHAFDPVSGEQLNGSGVPISALIALFFFLIVFTLAWKTAYGSWASQILIETDQELKKVAWPTWQLVKNSAIIVILCTLVFGILMFVSDFLLTWLIEKVFVLW